MPHLLVCKPQNLTAPFQTLVIQQELVFVLAKKYVVFNWNWHIIWQEERVSAEKSLPKLTPMLFQLEH